MSKKSHRSAQRPPARTGNKISSTGRAARPVAKGLTLWAYIGVVVVITLIIFTAVVLSRNGDGGGAAVQALPAEISVADAKARSDAGAFVLDVREPNEWEEYHAPGARLIPLGSLESRVSEVPRDKDIVVVCRSGNRSKEGRDILLKAGFTRVTSMAGGLSEWKAQGFPTVSGK